MNRKYLTSSAVAVCWLITTLTLSVRAAEEPAATPEQALRFLKEGNQRFAADRLAAKDVGAAKRKELVAGQRPFAILLSCADSRVPPEIVFDQGLGDLFVVRVAGNISEPFALGSIDYAVEYLHVPLIVVLGHEQCGAVASALGTRRPEGNLGKLVDEIHPGENLPAGKGEALAAAVRNNARRQAELLTERSRIIREHVGQKKLRIVSGVYSLSSGKVQWLESEK